VDGEARRAAGGDGAGRAAASSALDGLLVADFSRVLSGPLCTMLLGDLGADVVKVERPGTGDDTRAWGPPYAAGESTYYLSVNRNKRSVVLDLGADDDRRRARALAERADVLVENFRPGTMDRLGLGYDDLAAANPGLVYCSISGFGSGAGARLAGYDFLVQAVGGLMSITGQPDGEPTKVGVALVDVVAGLFATTGILAALRARERDGRGQRVEVNLLQSLLAALVNQASGYVAAGAVPRRMGNAHPSICPYETFPAADEPVALALGTDRQFALLCELLGQPELAADERFATNERRVAHREALRAALTARLRERPAAHWAEALSAAGLPCGKVNDVAEAFALAEQLGLDPIRHLPRADGGTVAQVASPLGLSATPPRHATPPPALGQHTDEVRAWLDSSSTRA
jgi:crotonobetainyl-CoA:carnitine CoA-transferase CaiB-like acyl-CoA transferase